MKHAKHQVTSRRGKAYQELSELSGHKTVLIEIREGRTQNAVELLEFEIDCLVSRLWHQQSEADDSTRDYITRFLRDMKAYRQCWPREVKCEALASEHLSSSEIQEAAKEATDILASV